MGAAPDLSEPQASNNVSLQMMIDQTFTFCRMFLKKLHHLKILTFDMSGQSGSGSGTLFAASSFRFYILGLNLSECTINIGPRRDQQTKQFEVTNYDDL